MVPAGSDVSVSRATIFESFGLTINDVVPVANVSDRTQLVSDLNGAGVGPSSSRPLVVARADAPGLHRVEITFDGSVWLPVSGTLRFASTGAMNSFGTANGSLLSVGDEAWVGSTRYVWSGSAFVVGTDAMVLLTQQSFSAASSVNVDGVFSSRFTNYLARFNIRGLSAGGQVGLQMRQNGNSAAAANYLNVSRTSGTGGGGVTAGSGVTGSFPLHIPNVAALYADVKLFDPFETTRTAVVVESHGYGGTTLGENGSITGHHTQGVAYDGFRLITNGPTITGQLSVFGLA